MMPLRTQVSRTMEEAIKQVKNVIQQQEERRDKSTTRAMWPIEARHPQFVQPGRKILHFYIALKIIGV